MSEDSQKDIGIDFLLKEYELLAQKIEFESNLGGRLNLFIPIITAAAILAFYYLTQREMPSSSTLFVTMVSFIVLG